MPINPFPRITPLDIPTALPSAARADPSVFANIGSIGDAIGEYRERNAMGELLRGAVDPRTGTLDLNKAATAIALSGRDPVKYLSLLEAEARRKEAGSYRQEALDVARQGRDIQERQFKLQEEQAKRPDIHNVPPTFLSPGYQVITPRTGDQPPTIRPYTVPSVPDTPAPQSALPGGPDLAAVEPDIINPEEAPPYRVAGQPLPPPTTVAQAAPAAAAPERNERFLQSLPTPQARQYIKDLAEYKQDPGKASKEELAAAAMYRPGFDVTEFQKRGTPPSGEVASRIGLAKGFLDLLPDIRQRIQSDELNTLGGRTSAYFGQGRPGELANAISEGAEALLRGLTGAGMSIPEASDYAKRYKFVPYDTKETQQRKINGLERALRYVTTEVGKGRGGDDLLKEYRSQFGKDVVEQAPVAKVANERQTNQLVGYAREALKNKTHTREYLINDLRQRGVLNPELLLGE